MLRGEEFNSVNENGDRVIRALAAGMGVARKDLKAMADNGKLTADKVVPALISQLGALRDEYAAMPDTVSSSATKVENAFMASGWWCERGKRSDKDTLRCAEWCCRQY